MLRTYRRSNKYQFYVLWFDQIGAAIHVISLRLGFRRNVLSVLHHRKCSVCSSWWRTNRKFLRNPNLNEITIHDLPHSRRSPLGIIICYIQDRVSNPRSTTLEEISIRYTNVIICYIQLLMHLYNCIIITKHLSFIMQMYVIFFPLNS
jgi:hypothetical protein